MSLGRIGQFRDRPGSAGFNMTPIIDVVFLLIIFFLVVCRFIEAENFPVAVPDSCEFAQSDSEAAVQTTTLTVMKRPGEEITFAVGPEEIPARDDRGVGGTAKELAKMINERLKDFPPNERIVTLRIDKEIPFAQAQYALAAVAQSAATDIQLAVLSGKVEPDIVESTAKAK